MISKQKLVIYKDSLNAKKILGNKRMHPRLKILFSLLASQNWGQQNDDWQKISDTQLHTISIDQIS